MIEDRRIEAVVFDVGRVIVEWDLRHLFARIIEDPQELEWFCTHVVNEEWHFQADAGRSLAEMVAERKAQFPVCAHWIDAYANRFLETIPGPVPGTCQIIEQLARAGRPLYAITNFGAEFWEQFYPAMPIFRHFRDIVVSGVERVAKPDPAIFHLAEKRFGHDPGAMFFIDDSPANIEAARLLGWQTHLFVGADRLRQELVRRGVIEG